MVLVAFGDSFADLFDRLERNETKWNTIELLEQVVDR